MIVTEREACGDQAQNIPAMQCRAVPLLMIPVASPHLAMAKQPQINYLAASCVGSQCMGWSWYDDENQATPRRGHCGFAAP